MPAPCALLPRWAPPMGRAIRSGWTLWPDRTGRTTGRRTGTQRGGRSSARLLGVLSPRVHLTCVTHPWASGPDLRPDRPAADVGRRIVAAGRRGGSKGGSSSLAPAGRAPPGGGRGAGGAGRGGRRGPPPPRPPPPRAPA